MNNDPGSVLDLTVWLKPSELAPSETTAVLLPSFCLCNSSIPSSKVFDSITATCFAGGLVDSDQVTFFGSGEASLFAVVG